MRIYEMMTNRIENPLGFRFDAVRLSYKVDQTAAKRQVAARIVVSDDERFEATLYDSGKSESIDSLCHVVPIALKPYTRYYWRVTVWADDGSVETSGAAWFETAKRDDKWTAQWISPDAAAGANADIVKALKIGREVAWARAYMSGLGLYEFYLNGEKVGDEYFTPYCNAYDQWIQYQTWDITDMLKTGENGVRVMLGDGWYKGRFGFQTNMGNIYGDKQALIMEVRVRYADGSEEVFASDDTWKCTESKVRFANFYDGEVYDATHPCDREYPVAPIDLGVERLTERLSLPVKVMERIDPTQVIRTPAGETVIDLGQEITGWLAFKTSAPAGTELKLYYGEILQHGNFYNENLRTAKAEYTYIADGKETWVRPHFTFFGFRYVKLEGFGDSVDLKDFVGCVAYSDMRQTGFVKTSNEKVNRLALNALWGHKGNYLDVPTDCPQRDERMGWTGDAQAFCGTACFQMEVAAFLQKYMFDMKKEQDKFSGSVPHVIPSFEMGAGGSCAWGDAATVIPWTLYLFYGDLELLREQYGSMRDWVEFIYRTDEASGGTRLWHVGFHFADWLALDTENGTPIGGTDSHYVASGFYYYSTTLLLKAAKALGYEDDVRRYEKLAGEILEALRREYFTPNGRLGESTQTAYIMALFMQYAPEEHLGKLTGLLENKFKASNEKLRTGFVGTSYLNRTLTQVGLNDLAYKLLLNEEYPGWLYEVNMGATTVWERWNSVLPNGLISDVTMNSLNHYAYGAILEWVFRDVAGLNPVECAPGFRKALIRPRPSYRLPKVAVEYESAAGRYKVAWEIRADRRFEMKVSVPFGAEAKCVLPYGDVEALSAAHPDLAFAAEGEDAACTLAAGDYVFDYMPVKPLHEVFTLDTPVRTLMNNAPLWEALIEVIPDLNRMKEVQISGEQTLRMLQRNPFVAVTDEIIEKLQKTLDSFN